MGYDSRPQPPPSPLEPNSSRWRGGRPPVQLGEELGGRRGLPRVSQFAAWAARPAFVSGQGQEWQRAGSAATARQRFAPLLVLSLPHYPSSRPNDPARAETGCSDDDCLGNDGLGVRRALEHSVALAPCMELLAVGTGHPVEADRACVPGRRLGRQSRRNSLARHPAPDHHTWQVRVRLHGDRKLRRQV